MWRSARPMRHRLPLSLVLAAILAIAPAVAAPEKVPLPQRLEALRRGIAGAPVVNPPPWKQSSRRPARPLPRRVPPPPPPRPPLAVAAQVIDLPRTAILLDHEQQL